MAITYNMYMEMALDKEFAYNTARMCLARGVVCRLAATFYDKSLAAIQRHLRGVTINALRGCSSGCANAYLVCHPYRDSDVDIKECLHPAFCCCWDRPPPAAVHRVCPHRPSSSVIWT